ncbi:MAG: hypothetical protein V4580_20005 [Bacteroidota bacterium]
MILLETTIVAKEGSSLYIWICNNYADILTTLAVILNALYVFYTVRTFRQIKKQTDLQLNAHLSSDIKLVNNLAAENKQICKTQYINTDLSDSWKITMQHSFPDLTSDTQLFDGNYFALKFSNYGNTEIKSIDIQIDILIKNSKNCIENKKLTPSESKQIKFHINEEIAKGESIVVPLFPTASFPIFSVKVTIKHKDVRGTLYPLNVIQHDGENKYIQ